jgi:hypothetical protein
LKSIIAYLRKCEPFEDLASWQGKLLFDFQQCCIARPNPPTLKLHPFRMTFGGFDRLGKKQDLTPYPLSIWAYGGFLGLGWESGGT